jgi:hypothetical protein
VKTKTSAKGPLSAVNLKSVLWDTINKVSSNEMTAGNADAVAGQAREILRTVRTQLMVSSQTGRPVPIEVVDFSESVDR